MGTVTPDEVSPGIRLIRAPNPGPMTLQGTNTWLLGEPDDAVLVVDPGPDDEGHLDRIRQQAGRIAAILITHRHADHTAGAPRLSARAGCDVRAVDPEFRVGTKGLREGETLSVGRQQIEVVSTPGHTSDSVCFTVSRDGAPTALLSGDTVLGQGTTVIAAPDGDVAAYLASLDRLERLVAERGIAQILPGHGPVITDPAAVLQHYVRHRHERLDQVRAALAAGDRTTEQVVARVYAAVDRAVWPAARQSVEAQLRYLEEHG